MDALLGAFLVIALVLSFAHIIYLWTLIEDLHIFMDSWKDIAFTLERALKKLRKEE